MISYIRKYAQATRHSSLLRNFNPLWNALRGPYLWLLQQFGSGGGIEVTVGGISMRLHPDFATQNWETVEYDAYRAFVALISEGDVIIDIGAHIGTYAIIAAVCAGPRGRVIAFEPNEAARRYLEKHLRWNDVIERTSIRNVGCGASAGKAKFYHLPGRAEGMSGLVAVDGFAETTIDVTTLDDEMESHGVIPSVIKIDVEGAEWDVLQGASRTLERHHPKLMLSLHPQALASCGVEVDQVLSWLHQHGYQHRVVAHDHEIHVVAQHI